jgi:hypothetical protein
MDMSVALLMDQRSVADWPRSMLDGSAVKLLMTAREGPGVVDGGVFVTGGGGGGGGGFFLHPAISINNESAMTTAPV